MNKLNLNILYYNEINKRDLSYFKGGELNSGYIPTCQCACKYVNQGGSSTCYNSVANFKSIPLPKDQYGCPENDTNSKIFWIGVI